VQDHEREAVVRRLANRCCEETEMCKIMPPDSEGKPFPTIYSAVSQQVEEKWCRETGFFIVRVYRHYIPFHVLFSHE
jgi:hypothetical protein